ncbi:MAG TPA: isochorismatase family cysteine hydrolase [Acidimicrobiales bacterium]|nr:isochorismatase family cysteine hydrolase [Acidimicrobiales bacterium]
MPLDLTTGRVALVVVDIQAGVTSPRSVLPQVGAPEAVARAVEVLDAARAAGLPVIHFKEVHRKEMVDFGRELDGAEPVHCLETWPDTDYHPDTYPIDGEFPMQKRRYSCFVGTDLDILLRGLKVDTLVLVGGMTNVCVHYTFADAHQLDYHAFVVEDAVSGSDWDAHHAALRAMAYLQRESRITAAAFVAAARSSDRSGRHPAGVRGCPGGPGS